MFLNGGLYVPNLAQGRMAEGAIITGRTLQLTMALSGRSERPENVETPMVFPRGNA